MLRAAYYYVCVLILLCLCPHASIYVFSYYYTCVLILLHMCPHATTYVRLPAEALYMCLYMCPHTAIYVLTHSSIKTYSYEYEDTDLVV